MGNKPSQLLNFSSGRGLITHTVHSVNQLRKCTYGFNRFTERVNSDLFSKTRAGFIRKSRLSSMMMPRDEIVYIVNNEMVTYDLKPIAVKSKDNDLLSLEISCAVSVVNHESFLRSEYPNFDEAIERIAYRTITDIISNYDSETCIDDIAEISNVFIRDMNSMVNDFGLVVNSTALEAQQMSFENVKMDLYNSAYHLKKMAHNFIPLGFPDTNSYINAIGSPEEKYMHEMLEEVRGLGVSTDLEYKKTILTQHIEDMWNEELKKTEQEDESLLAPNPDEVDPVKQFDESSNLENDAENKDKIDQTSEKPSESDSVVEEKKLEEDTKEFVKENDSVNEVNEEVKATDKVDKNNKPTL